MMSHRHSFLLAGTVAREIGVPMDPAALLRVRDTESQTGLDRTARRRNVRGAFRAHRRKAHFTKSAG